MGDVRRTGAAGRGKAGLLLVGFLLVGGCGLPRAPITQGAGLPVLRPLDWGYGYVGTPTWSPNGRWIAILAGNDYAGSQLAVVSPDGHYRQDLSAWGCGYAPTFSFAWRPDSSLSCVNNAGRLITGAYPFTKPKARAVSPPLHPYDNGATWSPDGTYLLVASSTDPQDPDQVLTASQLYAVDLTGRVAGPVSPPGAVTFELNKPEWVPGAGSVSWVTGNDVVRHDLMASAVVDWDGQRALAAPRVLATDIDGYYAWAPSGRWAVVRYGNYQGGDRVYLVDAQHPAETVDVVHADRAGQPLAMPIWSPDDQTLIVIGVADEQPYAIDIASYLHGKGLAP